MQKSNTTSQDANHPIAKIAKEEVDGRTANPRRHYQSPEMLMADESLSDTEKHDLLCGWKLDLDNRLMAEEEGMSASDPIDRRDEARLAEESARVNTVLAKLTLSLARA